MNNIHSHYDNLKVARNAPLEVIRAAYKALAQKYHPDRNDSPDAIRVMKIINEAWDVLSDPTKRAKHDKWLAEEERCQASNQNRKDGGQGFTNPGTAWAYPKPEPRNTNDTGTDGRTESPPFAPKSTQQQKGNAQPTHIDSPGWSAEAELKKARARLLLIPALALLALLSGVGLSALSSRTGGFDAKQASQSIEPVNRNQGDAATKPQSTPKSDPNVLPERKPRDESKRTKPESQYIFDPVVTSVAEQVDPRSDKEYRDRSGPLGKQLAQGGLSTFKIDNSQGSNDVVVRLYREGKKPAVRSFVVKKGESFTSKGISPGSYIMRHRQIGSEETFEADQVFELTEKQINDAIQFSNITVTMYDVRNGNLSQRRVSNELF